MSPEPESPILQLLRDIRAETGDMRVEMATTGDLADLRSEVTSLRADVASDIHVTRKEVGKQIVGLRRAVVDYHTSVIGHGVLISELEARLRRVEQHLDLPPRDAH